MKTYVIVIVVLILGFLAFGVYAANNNYGFIALLAGLVLGNLLTNLSAELKRGNKTRD